MEKQELKEMRAYESFIDALNHRRRVILEHLNNTELPENLRKVYESKLRELEQINFAFF